MQYIYYRYNMYTKKVIIWQMNFHPNYVAFSHYTILLTNDFMLLTIPTIFFPRNILSLPS